jgi:hypothetical protein
MAGNYQNCTNSMETASQTVKTSATNATRINATPCTMLKVGMKVLSDNNCELLVLDKSDKKQGS